MKTLIYQLRANDLRSYFKCRKGAAAVEFALVLWLLMLLLFGMVEWGLYLFNQQVLTNACREGARAGIVSRANRLLNSEIESIVRNYSEQHLVTFGNIPLNISIKPIDYDLNDGFDPSTHRCVQFGCDLEVKADYAYGFLFLPSIGINSINIATLARMKME